MKILHTADIHTSMKADKYLEVVTTTTFLAEKAEKERLDVIIIAGDTADEADGRINLDSTPTRYIIELVTRLAVVAPVLVLRGTPSHDRECLHILKHIATKHPVYVADEFEQVALSFDGGSYQMGYRFNRVPDGKTCKDDIALFTCLPSPDKSKLLSGLSIEATVLSANEVLHDAIRYFGEINKQQSIPCIAVGHGTITGATTGVGWEAIGQDMEFSVSDLQLLNCDVTCFGHFHKAQEFPGKIFYSGSPGRLNFGETETKGFYFHNIDGNRRVTSEFVETPARRFAMFDHVWDKGVGYELLLEQAEGECHGSDVRFRISIPEEERHKVDKDSLEAMFKLAGANEVKVEITIIPKVRQRAEGISKLETLPEKLRRWAETVGEELPERVLNIARTIEGESVDEIVTSAKVQAGI